MDINILINQHINWKSLIEGLFQGSDTDILDPNVISKDDECDFGKWIYMYSDDNQDLLSNPLFIKIKNVHKIFHQITGNIVFDFQSGNIEKAKNQIPDFNKISEELVQLMKELEIELKK